MTTSKKLMGRAIFLAHSEWQEKDLDDENEMAILTQC
jgi:hypothetical protein